MLRNTMLTTNSTKIRNADKVYSILFLRFKVNKPFHIFIVFHDEVNSATKWCHVMFNKVFKIVMFQQDNNCTSGSKRWNETFKNHQLFTKLNLLCLLNNFMFQKEVIVLMMFNVMIDFWDNSKKMFSLSEIDFIKKRF